MYSMFCPAVDDLPREGCGIVTGIGNGAQFKAVKAVLDEADFVVKSEAMSGQGAWKVLLSKPSCT